MHHRRIIQGATIYGKQIERYLFNFRIAPERLREKLPPVSWLKPRLVNGYGVVSFCLLRLEGVTLWPLPNAFGLKSTACAYRCAVADTSEGSEKPSVYILGRNTNLTAVSRFGSLLLSAPMHTIRSSIKETPSTEEIRTSHADGSDLFSARINKASPDPLEGSRLYEGDQDFTKFIKCEVSSYTPSIASGLLSRVDLVEGSSYFKPVRAQVLHHSLEDVWSDSDLEFDSAFHTGSGGRYILKYMGSVPSESGSRDYATIEKEAA